MLLYQELFIKCKTGGMPCFFYKGGENICDVIGIKLGLKEKCSQFSNNILFL